MMMLEDWCPLRLCCWRTVATLLLLSLGGCEVQPGAGSTDAAGTESTSSDTLSTIPLSPSMRIGAVEDDGSSVAPIFGRLVDVVFSEASSEIVALDVFNHEGYVLVLDSAGTARLTFGRRGQGPGELNAPRQVVARSDTIGIVDQRGLHLFTREGLYLASSVPMADGAATIMRVYATEVGWLATVAVTWPGENVGRVELHHLVGGDSVPRVLRTLYNYGEANQVVEGGYIVGPLFGYVPVAAVDGHGKVLLASKPSYEIEVFGPEGDSVSTIEGPAERQPVTAELVEGYMARQEQRCESFPGSGECPLTAVVMPAVLSLPMPSFRPVIRSLFVSPDGRILVERLDLDPRPFQPGDRRVFDVFTRAGHIYARVSTPPGFTPSGFGGDAIWGVSQDALGVSYVVKLPLAGGEGG